MVRGTHSASEKWRKWSRPPAKLEGSWLRGGRQGDRKMTEKIQGEMSREEADLGVSFCFFFCNLGPVFSCLPRSALSFRTQLPGWSPHSRILREAVSSQIHPRIFCEPCVFLVLPFFYVPDPTENPSFILASYCLCFSGTHHPRGKYSYFSLCIWMFGVSGRDFSTA